MIPNLGTRRELFLDGALIERMRGTRLCLQKPERREIVFTGDAAWEDCVAFPDSLVPWRGGWRLYYRAGILDWKRENETSVAALAESSDGLTFQRPELGLCEFDGTRRNNILKIGGTPRIPPPFLDGRPGCPPGQSFKGLSHLSHPGRLYALASADGLRWAPLQQEPLEYPGHFDTINTAFWDKVAGCYRSYTRVYCYQETGEIIKGDNLRPIYRFRAIQHATSPDFIHWSAPELLRYSDREVVVQLYTNAILPCPGAEHFYLGFPNRFVPERTPYPEHNEIGVNDALFMSSRDGVNWNRWLDAWVAPGLDRLNWTERNNYPAWGIAVTSPTEWSMYISEHYRHPGLPTRLRRLAIRPWGFVSVRADYKGGEMKTKPFVFGGTTLRLNARTSAAGSMRVEIRDGEDRPVPGFTAADMEAWYGDALDAPVSWKGGNPARLAGKPVRLRFLLKDADLFGMRWTGEDERGVQ